MSACKGAIASKRLVPDVVVHQANIDTISTMLTIRLNYAKVKN
ncbi:hypothetical protein [Amazonocrinis nigriterrae]|nr:hypothetical protein [Amazonocrinis nigriterrae]